MNLDEIEKSYKKIKKNFDSENYDELNLLIKELEINFLLPLMESNSLIRMKKTKEWNLYVELFNLKKSCQNKKLVK